MIPREKLEEATRRLAGAVALTTSDISAADCENDAEAARFLWQRRQRIDAKLRALEARLRSES